MENKNKYLNFGAGNPVEGWMNLDSSPLFILPRSAHRLLFLLRLSIRSQYFIKHDYKYFQYRSGHSLPYSDGSLDAIYCSHVFEHLLSASIPSLMDEFRRTLVQGGILRVVVPDLESGMKATLAARTPWNDISQTLGTLPSEIRNNSFLAAIEGLFHFPSSHKTVILRNNLSSLANSFWSVKVGLDLLESGIDIDKLKQVENEERCRNAIIFEMKKNI